MLLYKNVRNSFFERLNMSKLYDSNLFTSCCNVQSLCYA